MAVKYSETSFRMWADRMLRDAERIVNPPPPLTRWQRVRLAWKRYWSGW